MLKAGIITPASSAGYFFVVIVIRKDVITRFCVENRILNPKMKADRWALPKIEEIFDDLKGTSVFDTLYLFARYWYISMSEDCKEMKALVSSFGTFK